MQNSAPVRTIENVTPARAPSYAEIVAMFRRGPERRVDVGHSRLAYYRIGKGPDAVFVHGWPLSSATFRAIAPRIAEHFTCHFLDLPGTPNTESDPAAPMNLIEHAETLRRAVDELGLSQYALIAHDSGGGVARFLAAEDTRVCALVSGNTEIPGHTPKLVAFYAAVTRIPGARATLRASMKLRSVRRSALGFGNFFADLRILDGDFHELLVEPLLGSARAFANQSRLIADLDFRVFDQLREVHARIRVPVLLIWGSADPFFPLAKARAMLNQFGGPVELRPIEGAKLLAHEDHPAEFVAHALPFLKQVFA
jgi:pimeloyl-ACP methyl ester carboxylesterase